MYDTLAKLCAVHHACTKHMVKAKVCCQDVAWLVLGSVDHSIMFLGSQNWGCVNFN